MTITWDNLDLLVTVGLLLWVALAIGTGLLVGSGIALADAHARRGRHRHDCELALEDCARCATA